jgi:hypothetical protein
LQASVRRREFEQRGKIAIGSPLPKPFLGISDEPKVKAISSRSGKKAYRELRSFGDSLKDPFQFPQGRVNWRHSFIILQAQLREELPKLKIE